MLITVGIYVTALFSTLSANILILSVIMGLLCVFLLLKKLFDFKYIFVWALVFLIGVANTSLRLRQTDELLSIAPQNAGIKGTIVSIPQKISGDKARFFFKVKEISLGNVVKDFKAKEKVLVTVNSDVYVNDTEHNLKLYNDLILKGRLSTPFKAGNPSQFDYGNYLRNHNAYAVFYADEFESLHKKASLKEQFMQGINDFREEIIGIHSKYLHSPNLEILGGIVFGDDAVAPPQNIKQSFINSGLLHILAASGMNVAFIYVFFFIFMSLFRAKFKVRVLLGMGMVVVYSLMTGLGASVIRATIMLLFVLIGKLIDRDAHSISLLSFVALLMLLYNPLWINDVGFQLSFIVTFGILLMAPAFDRFENKFANFILSTVAVPIIAQLWVIPIQIFYFNNISIYSVFANIMSVPIIMVLSFGGFISSLLSAIKPIADFVCHIFDFVLNPLITLLVNISDYWGKLPFSTLQTSHPSILQIMIYYAILLCLSILLYKELREKYLKRSIISLSVLILMLLVSFIPIKNSNLEITAFDVGNADCFLIKTPENKYIMIDTGKFGYNGGKSQAEIIMIKYLKDKGVKELDSIILTHFDNDHCGGAVDLINSVKVNKLYLNDVNHESNAAKMIYKAADSMDVKKILVQNKQTVYENNKLKIVNLNKYNGRSDNDNSIITLLTYKDFSMLFTGDAGLNGIYAVLEDIPKNITVLKAAHHGAMGCMDKKLAAYLNPKYTIVSTGENQFGHPSLYTLELLKNSVILRTDLNNSMLIKVDINGNVRVMYYDIRSRKYKPIQ